MLQRVAAIRSTPHNRICRTVVLQSAPMNAKRNCAWCGGRWWIVYPTVGCNIAAALWLREWRPVSPSGCLYAIAPAILVFFTMVWMFPRAEKHVELGRISLITLWFAILVMALGGLMLSAGLVTRERVDRGITFSFYASIVGLGWILLYWTLKAIAALRMIGRS